MQPAVAFAQWRVGVNAGGALNHYIIDKHYQTDYQFQDRWGVTLGELMNEMVSPLHDGHFSVQFQNHQTGKFVLADPGSLRMMQRDDHEASLNFSPVLTAYQVSGEATVVKEYSTKVSRLRIPE